MLLRLALQLLMMMGPRLLPPLLRYLRLIWRLTFDKRVPLILRALVPLSLIYFLLPWDLIPDRFGLLSKFDDFIIMALAVLLLTKLAPKHVVDEHLGKQPVDDRPQEKDPDKVVDGSSRLLDEE